MRILILNWRCPRNPRAGGAEHLTYEVAKRLVAWGNEVEWFSASFPGAEPVEDIDGIRVVRQGRQWTVHLHAFRRYYRRLRPRFDVVLDEVNTIPFFAPLWSDVPVFMLIYQLARDVWWHEMPFPLSAVGYVSEPVYLQCYRHVPILTISASTANDLGKLGLRGPINVIRVGIDMTPVTVVEKGAVPRFLYVGRLAPSKRVGHIIRAFAQFRREVGVGVLSLIGDGAVSHRKRLIRLVEALGLTSSVEFLGPVTRDEKFRRMAEADALLMASVREGWGLVVTEANACGTPAIVYDVNGLRDAVLHEQTGLIVDASPTRLAEGMLRLWNDPQLCERLATGAREWSAQFSLDGAAANVHDAIELALRGPRFEDEGSGGDSPRTRVLANGTTSKP